MNAKKVIIKFLVNSTFCLPFMVVLHASHKSNIFFTLLFHVNEMIKNKNLTFLLNIFSEDLSLSVPH